MKNYRILNLPKDPLVDSNYILEKAYNRNDYAIEDVSIFRPEILKQFLDMGLEPDFVAIFICPRPAGIGNRMIHSDIAYNSETDNWDDISFGINWDIKGQGIFRWWDIPENLARVYPIDQLKNDPVYKVLSGIHYGRRFKIGADENYKLIDEVSTTFPMLVRTNIPHCVTFDSPRLCASLRFKNSIDVKWQEIYHKFDHLT